MSVWLLCALLSPLIVLTKQDGHTISIRDVKVSADKTGTLKYGTWVLNVEWRDENNESEEVSYDIEVLYSEQMRTVHFETIRLKANKINLYRWKWTSPIPLQCTSHSVRIRRRDRDRDGEWTQFYEYIGKDKSANKSYIYPQEQTFMVGSNVTYCCIVVTKSSSLYNSMDPLFTIPISNRTYVTNPIHFNSPSVPVITCEISGTYAEASVFIGYPPDDHNLTCVTRNLKSVVCHWKRGRDTHLYDPLRKTNYTLNGRECQSGQCEITLEKQETNWTLIAKNLLGVKTMTYTADPTKRVWLTAPIEISSAADARKVTLHWKWDVNEYANFPMICQAMLNESIYNKTFIGEGLKSVVLEHLQPYSSYTAKVRCGSHENFYRWGDWSEIAMFKTKEDIPEAVDVWGQHYEQNTYVLWKPLKPQQSHGVITKYKITANSDSTYIEINEKCFEIGSGNGKSGEIFSISAINSAGLSPPSTVIIPADSGRTVKVTRINSTNGGFELFWEKHLNSTCGYVVEWFPTYRMKQCGVEWMRIPECDGDVCTIQIPQTIHPSDLLKAGVKYTILVYACVDDAPVLLQRREGYAIEEGPSMTVQNLRPKEIGNNVELSWDEVPLENQRGFIQGYKVKKIHSEKTIDTVVTKERKVNFTLGPGSYFFKVSAFTSGGESDDATCTVDVSDKIERTIVATVVGCSAAIITFIIITVFCFKKRKWLKKLFYPDIPEPIVTGKWATKGIHCTLMTERYMKCEIQKVHSSQCPETSESPHGLDSKDILLPAEHFYQNTSPVHTSYYPSPSPCDKNFISIIENPFYNMTTPEPVDVAQMSNLPLEMDDSYIPAPQFNQNEKNSEGYKPQSK